MIAKAFEYNGRGRLELNVSIGEAKRIKEMLSRIEPRDLPERVALGMIIAAIDKGWGFD